jgi:ABC-type Na+ efflux pump permease subunit
METALIIMLVMIMFVFVVLGIVALLMMILVLGGIQRIVQSIRKAINYIMTPSFWR